ncbi:toxin-activating lysine-acyltransferase [Kiloniella majae]|uniref:toxin-activating lysine-acyltransferase n=1 Tax=Kiloniella majae TaxID=1938558 RepID=UPI000A2775C6|nr:toxin-activating lysine-acyltransferase [Kiloniella majae]
MPEHDLSETRQDSGPDDLNESASALNAEPTQSSSYSDVSDQTNTGKADNQDLDLIFGEVVSILMRSPLYQHCSLADLEWLVIPPLLTRQFQMVRGQAKGDGEGVEGKTYPIGVAFWAYVSEEVDTKLEAQKKAKLPIPKLAPQDWKSGDIPWLVTLVAPVATKELVKEKIFNNLKCKNFNL